MLECEPDSAGVAADPKGDEAVAAETVDTRHQRFDIYFAGQMVAIEDHNDGPQVFCCLVRRNVARIFACFVE